MTIKEKIDAIMLNVDPDNHYTKDYHDRIRIEIYHAMVAYRQEGEEQWG